MNVYLGLSRHFWPGSYLGKIMVVSFVGVHIPMIGAVAWILLGSDLHLTDVLGVLVALLIATLVGTLATLLTLYALLAPVREAARAIRAYLADKTVPRLPTDVPDEVGHLMANIQESITRLDAAVDAAEARAEDATLAKQQNFRLLSGLSHEFRTPLNHIIGFAELMSSEALGPLGRAKYKEYAGDIGSSGGKLLDVLQTVLDLSEVEAETPQEEPERLDCRETVDAAVGLVHFQARETGVGLSAAVRPGLALLAAPRIAKQALLHALRVSVEAAGREGTVRLSARQAGERVLIEVAHDGPAWDTVDLPQDLQREQTGPASGNLAAVSPTALRLALIRTLLRFGDGGLAIERTEPQGNRLILSLPAAGVEALAA